MRPPEASPRRARRAKQVALLLATLAISSCALEVAYRVFTTLKHRWVIANFEHELCVLHPDDDVAYTLRPFAARSNKIPGFAGGDWAYAIGADGLRARPDSAGSDGAVPPDSARRRILVLGDSYAFGWGLDQSLDPFPSALEKLLARDPATAGTVVVNAGVPGYCTAQEAWLLERLLSKSAPESLPDLVALAYVMNDAEPQLSVPASPRALYRDTNFWLLARVKEGLNRLAPRGAPFLRTGKRQYDYDYRRGFEPGNPKGRESIEALGRMVAACRARGIGFALFILPDFSKRFGDSYPYEGVHAMVAAAGRKLGVPTFDLLPRFRGEDSEALRIPVDFHPNAEGHRRIAEAMAEAVREMARGEDAAADPSANATR